MNADEYEARLRVGVWIALRRDCSDCQMGLACPYVSVALDAYADWLRLRAVAGVPCIEERSTLELCFGDCVVHDARRRMTEILAAAEVTG